jgi:zinc/manganese transport system permease protein
MTFDPVAWFIAPLDYQFMVRAVVMAALLGISGGLVGVVLVLRRLSLMADSFGHALLPGIGIAYLLFGISLGGMLAGAAIAGLLTALASGLVSRLTRLGEDASFAAFFTMFVAIGVALLSRAAAPVDLLHYLFGNILGITSADLMLSATVTTVTVIAFAVGWRWIVLECFDRAFFKACGGPSALTHMGLLTLTVANLVSAMQAVGAMLSVALFILPAATSYLWCERFVHMVVFAGSWGSLAAVFGLYVSFHTDLPSGACIVGVLGAGFLTTIAVSPRHGLLRRWTGGSRHLREDAAGDCPVAHGADPHGHAHH